jgi:hypothetical protein
LDEIMGSLSLEELQVPKTWLVQLITVMKSMKDMPRVVDPSDGDQMMMHNTLAVSVPDNGTSPNMKLIGSDSGVSRAAVYPSCAAADPSPTLVF